MPLQELALLFLWLHFTLKLLGPPAKRNPRSGQKDRNSTDGVQLPLKRKYKQQQETASSKPLSLGLAACFQPAFPTSWAAPQELPPGKCPITEARWKSINALSAGKIS